MSYIYVLWVVFLSYGVIYGKYIFNEKYPCICQHATKVQYCKGQTERTLWVLFTSNILISFRISASKFDYNLAHGKIAYQSSNHIHPLQPTAAKAVDGNRDPTFNHGSCAHTESSTQPFWVVDLGNVYRIAYVTITNRLGKHIITNALIRN